MSGRAGLRAPGRVSLLPESALFLIRPHVRREALLSSQIEGTPVLLSELLLFGAGGRPPGVSHRRCGRGFQLRGGAGPRRGTAAEGFPALLTDLRGRSTPGCCAMGFAGPIGVPGVSPYVSQN